jgi:hypothetical protein
MRKSVKSARSPDTSSAGAVDGRPEPRVRTRINRLRELDVASQAVLIEVVRALEEQLWMLRVQVPAERGQ